MDNFAFYIILFVGDGSEIYPVQDGFQCHDFAKTK